VGHIRRTHQASSSDSSTGVLSFCSPISSHFIATLKSGRCTCHTPEVKGIDEEISTNISWCCIHCLLMTYGFACSDALSSERVMASCTGFATSCFAAIPVLAAFCTQPFPRYPCNGICMGQVNMSLHSALLGMQGSIFQFKKTIQDHRTPLRA
jgi:hypothetical protein